MFARDSLGIMKFTASSIIFAFLAFLSAIMTGMAVPLEKRAARDVYRPPITSPAPGTTFERGETITVHWDTSGIPASAPNMAQIVLARPTNDSENIDFKHVLANGSLLTVGSANITWPRDVPAGPGYSLVLFGDSGNIFGPYNLN
ncbi:hypothetical protein M422DRAFT_66836 [Sphaerobolus stellatus SS14]|uniref:Unplaced genomic scaffold SPHSTscaffold_33, whole genome shotgun sequence n=1 Tax=Sphaerobolus stellatus (strain SS14) TaxID=990650 RepID=A0A0C9VUD8_SPHS4|nr:hypothetical protein M422DRAFT_66836 [Sphaerobolus stellatus SS14]